MKQFALFALAVMIALTASAQNKFTGIVKGKLVDSVEKESMGDASVSVISEKDSAVAGFSLSNAKGDFVIRDLDTGSFRLVISFKGFADIKRKFVLTSEKAEYDFGNLYMEKASVLLSEVVVEAAPITVKKDTIEFRASAFKTVPNATAEDLLKKIPGMEVDKEGNVKAQGEDIQKVYVDGKEFLRTDPKLATKNITADMIESVQVFDDMSDQAKFTRIDDGSRAKTINIKLKKDQRQGYFAKAVAGIGTEDRYQASLTLNSFKGDRRISILGSSNNLNRLGFNFSDIVSSMGGFGSNSGGGGGNTGRSNLGGGGNRGGNRGGGELGINNFGGGLGASGGITRSSSAGINYSNKLGSKLDVTGSYFFSESETRAQQVRDRETDFQNDSTAFRRTESNSVSTNQNHRFNLRMEYYIDSMNSLLYTPSLTLQRSSRTSFDTTSTRVMQHGLDYLAIAGITSNSNEREGTNLNNNLLFRHKFQTTGRTLTLGINNSINSSNGSGTLFSPLTYYQPDGTTQVLLQQDLENSQRTKSNNNVISGSYTEPLGKNKLLELNYAYTHNQSTSDRNAFNYNPASSAYDIINAAQTNYFENTFTGHRYGTNFRVQTEKYNFQLGGAVQTSTLINKSVRPIGANGKDSTINTRQDFTNLFPTANFNYTFSRTKNLRVNYRGRTSQPSISQLQDAPDFTDPTQIRNGNPLLKQEFANNVNINYNTFNPGNFRYLNVNINLGQTSNKIVNSINTVPKNLLNNTAAQNATQYILPVNLNGAMNASSYITFGIPLRNNLKGSSINFTNQVQYNRDVSLIYNQRNFTNTFSFTQGAGLNLNIENKLNMGLTARGSYNLADYSIQKEQNVKYYTQTYSTNVNYYLLPSLILSTDFDLVKNSGLGEGYNKAIPLWNASIAQLLFKKKNGEIRFSVNDILNQNQSISRTIGDNYTEDTRTTVLQRFFMLTFTYNLNKGGSGNSQRMQTPRGTNGMERRMDMNRINNWAS